MTTVTGPIPGHRRALGIALVAAVGGFRATGLTLAYGLYALFALLSGWFVIRAVRETTGRELEDMQATPGPVGTTADGFRLAAPSRGEGR